MEPKPNGEHSGLPRIVKYVISEDFGEIILHHEGPNLDKWVDRIEQHSKRKTLALCMVRDII